MPAAFGKARIDLDMPGNIKNLFQDYQSIFKRYGRVIHGLYAPNSNRQGTIECLKAFLDLMFLERGHQPLKGAETDARRIQTHITPTCSPIAARKRWAHCWNGANM